MKILFLFLLVSICEAASPKLDCRQRAIEDTLMMTLLVGSDARQKGEKLTWEQIQSRVRLRLRR